MLNTLRARLVEARGAVRGEREEGEREEGGEMWESQSQRREMRPLSAATSRNLKKTLNSYTVFLEVCYVYTCIYIVDVINKTVTGTYSGLGVVMYSSRKIRE